MSLSIFRQLSTSAEVAGTVAQAPKAIVAMAAIGMYFFIDPSHHEQGVPPAGRSLSFHDGAYPNGSQPTRLCEPDSLMQLCHK